MRVVWIAALLLTACGAPESESAGKRRTVTHFDHLFPPVAQGDVLSVDLATTTTRANGSTESSQPGEPLVTDETGTPVHLTPVEWADRVVGWAPTRGWQPGSYTLEGAIGQKLWTEGIPFQVGDWGVAPSDAEDWVGTSWRLSQTVAPNGSAWDANGFVGLGLSFGTLEVQIEALTDEGVLFSVVADSEMGACLVLRDEARWYDGSLGWSRIELTMDTGEAQVPTRDLALSMHFDPAFPDQAQGQLRGEVQARPLQRALFADPAPNELCDWTSRLGSPCHEGPDGADYTGTAAYGLSFYRVDSPIDPGRVCGIDNALPSPGPWEIEIAPIDCDLDLQPIDCSCSSGRGLSVGIPLWLMVLTVLARRRQ